MKQKLQHIILLIILALTWTTQAWGWGETPSYLVNDATTYTRSWSSGGGTIHEYTWSGTNAGVVTFYAKTSMTTTSNAKNLELQQYLNGSWSSVETFTITTSSKYYSKSINASATGVRFRVGGAYDREISNVKVARGSSTFTTSTSSLSFGNVQKGSSKSLTASITYINATYDQQVTGVVKDASNNTLSDFAVTSKTIGESGTNVSITITFTPSKVGTQSGTCTLTNTNGKTVSFSVSGTGLPVFKFSAAANKRYDYGTATATVTNSQIVGAAGDTQKSTTATFTATPNSGCTFVGWYTDDSYTTQVSTATTYTPTITNTAEGTTKNLTLYAWFKSNQTLTWTNPDVVNIVNGTTENGAAAATAKSAVTGTATGLTMTYESNHTEIATVNSSGDVTGVSASATSVTITATQAGNDEYNPVSATRDFYVVNKIEATFTPSGFSVADTIPLYVGATPTITLTDVDTDFTCISSNDEVVSRVINGNVITLTAHKVGTADVTLTQPNNTTHSSVSTTYRFKVVKVPNELSVSLPAQRSVQVGDTIHVIFPVCNNTITPITAEITNTLSSGVNNGTDVITYTNGIITACNAGTARITFSQAETDKYEGFTSSTYTVTVTKKTNPITITLAGGSSTNIKLKYAETATLAYSSAHSGTTISVNRIEGNYTTYSNGTIKAGNTQGTDIYAITQPETYNYEAGYNTFTIRVNNSEEKDGYVLYDDAEHGWSTISSYTPATLSGPGDNLSYEAYRWWGGANYFYVMISKNNGSSWEQYDNPDLPTSYQSYPTNKLPDGVTNVRFETHTGATSEKRVKNIFVTRKTYVTASSNKTAFGTVYTDDTPPTATITVNYSSTNGGNISISSNNAHFVPSISSISVESEKTATSSKGTTYICGVDGTQTFTVTYNPNPNQLGAESAVITIQDLFYTQQITLTATAAKHANTLAVIGAQNLKVEDVVGNVYTPSSKNSAAAITYSLSHDGVIEYDPLTNKITAVGAGSATLTISQAENNYHYGITKTVSVEVSKYDQTISWDYDLTDLTLEYGDTLTTNTATASTGMTVTYSSSNTDVLTVDPTTGKLEAVGGGSSVITATQAGNNKISAVSITRRFTVFKRDVATVTTSLSESGTNYFPIGNPAITIRANATLTEGSFTITGNSEGYVSVSFAENTNTLTISALKEGGPVIVTLTRDQDALYYAIDKSYTIQVVKPALVLNPASSPVIAYEEYSSVTLNRTLKAGYSTIALPFDTDVETLVADRAGDYDSDEDWVAQLSAVTSSVADGYTLYFQKVTGGTIEANEPYVLHLGSQVVNPTWTNLESGISVEAAEATSIGASTGYSGYAGWNMWSNFTPNFAMAGKYGIVNSEGGFMLGSGENAKLNAFAAYIAPPQTNGAPRLRVAYVDEDGNTTFVGSLPDAQEQGEPVAIYGPDGQRRSRMQRGVNIVRYADGTTKKVQY